MLHARPRIARLLRPSQPLHRGYSTPAVLTAWIQSAPTISLVQHDTVSVTRIQGLASSLETDGLAAHWKSGTPLPPTWSLVLFPPVASPISSLRIDGTEVTALQPPGSLERMWVSGAYQFSNSAALQVGREVQCVTVIESVKERVGKDGRTGWYVTQKREVSVLPPLGEANAEKELVETERRVHLYRAPIAAVAEQESKVEKKVKEVKGQQKKDADFSVDFLPTPNLLFRFSALTFNTHRIHWDESYAVGVERREGLIVHGPLLALLSLNTLRHTLPLNSHIASYEYRATAPLAVGKEISFCGKWLDDESGGRRSCELWVREKEGKEVMSGKAVVVLGQGKAV